MNIGDILSDRYLVESLIGTGGMANVYKCFDKKKRIEVAVKVLREELADDEEFVKRFETEARAASKVTHDSLVNMYGVGTQDGTSYIVMEYVPGRTLKQVISENGPMNEREAVIMAIRLLGGINHAHAHGIIHRDIKPQNIIVTEDGSAKIADFGIAKLDGAKDDKDGSEMGIGSVRYISPEQALGDQTDAESDIYSFGVVLYEMLTGKVPFDDPDPDRIAEMHVRETPASMREINPAIMPAIDRVVLKALEKDPDDRYHSAVEFARALKAAVKQPKPKKKRRGTGLRYVLAGAVIALALITGGYFVWQLSVEEMPVVIGRTESEANEILNGMFKVSVNHELSNEYPAGTVIKQQPGAGRRIRRNSDVVITVSSGSDTFALTSCVGMTCDDAMALLVELGAKNVRREYVVSVLDVGTVVRQMPESGEIAQSDPVILYVSGESVKVPAITGFTLENAEAMLLNANLSLGNVNETYTADENDGVVIAQSVRPNSSALAGSAIDVVIARRREREFTPLTDFRLAVPLDNTRVQIIITKPSGEVAEAYSDVLNRGTYSLNLTSTEVGLHTVMVYLDDIVMEETSLNFE